MATNGTKKSGGIGKWMRTIRMAADGLAGALGELLKEDGLSMREKASIVSQRYIGVGLDGSLDVNALANNAMGLATAGADDWIKRKTKHYQLIGNKHLLPTAGEGIPYLLSWDAAGIEGTAREKAAAAYDCFVESTSGYVPSTGDYPGIASARLRAYLLGSHGGRIGSRLFSRFAPKVQAAVRDFTGYSL